MCAMNQVDKIFNGLSFHDDQSFPTLNTFITQMVNYLDRNAAGFGFVEGAAEVAVEGVPGFLVTDRKLLTD